jgi:hypothetical protein
MAAAAAITQMKPSLSIAAQEQPPSREKLSIFSYADVKLMGGPLRAQQDRIHASYLGLDEDKLLKVYRQRAGLPAPGEDIGNLSCSMSKTQMCSTGTSLAKCRAINPG